MLSRKDTAVAPSNRRVSHFRKPNSNPEGREAIASIIESYERLIALVERKAK